MDGDLNLTHRLGEWRNRPGTPSPEPEKPAEPPPPAPPSPPKPVAAAQSAHAPGERHLRTDGFMWFAFAVAAVFFMTQLVLLAGWI